MICPRFKAFDVSSCRFCGSADQRPLFSAGFYMKGFACRCGRHARYDCVTTRSMPVMLTALDSSRLCHSLWLIVARETKNVHSRLMLRGEGCFGLTMAIRDCRRAGQVFIDVYYSTDQGQVSGIGR